MAEKNLQGKTVKRENAYEVWTNGAFTYYVLKKYQAPDKEAKNPYARWFVSTDSPFVTDELGDAYVSDVKRGSVRIK